MMIRDPNYDSPLIPQVDPQKKENDLEVFSIRWFMLIMFVFSGVANALVLLSFSPISNLANDYWGGIGITAVNLLAISFQIMYLPGTMLALYISKNYNLRSIMLVGGSLTFFGCGVRYLGAILKGSMSDVGSYVVILLGTCIVAAAQPFYLNMPAKIAGTWFAVKERDISTTLCSLANPLGSAVGSFIPAYFVTETNLDGVQNLLLVHFIVSVAAFVLTFSFFRSQPPKPPSYSAMQMESSLSSSAGANMSQDFSSLLGNVNYLGLLFSFTISLGNLNALAALINQLPGGYSNSEVGLTGAVLILSGFVGAFSAGFVLEYTKAYKTILKVTYTAAVGAWVLFACSCRPGGFPFFVGSAALLGFSLLPTIPATIINSVESSYPVREDLAVGLLYISANVTAIAMTFIGQELLQQGSLGPAPLFPYGIWALGTMFVALVPILLFNGRYLRLEEDQGSARLLSQGDNNIVA